MQEKLYLPDKRPAAGHYRLVSCFVCSYTINMLDRNFIFRVFSLFLPILRLFLTFSLFCTNLELFIVHIANRLFFLICMPLPYTYMKRFLAQPIFRHKKSRPKAVACNSDSF